ncbi:DUF2272 domain-containing protein (plasmid) [Leisingera sp. M527]|uniref:DUF2272 domain-containing protein n=1 Tax=Leisingera sp. M527 TaxID=2867014 RepID=UPI0021A5FE2C|nr:DUF2272 domain-containing protein [Leisingera sp. M527]UWQ35364.1 DUF2272 domain-containing protein [Leisingera sp. M527]
MKLNEGLYEMPTQNPFLDEIDRVVTAIIELKMEQASADSGQAAAIAAEVAAKTQVINALQSQSEDWRLQRLDVVVNDLRALAETELAKQARLSARLRALLVRVGGAPTVALEPPSPPPPVTTTTTTKATSTTTSSTNAEFVGLHVRIEITPQDFDALCRVSQSEVGHFAKHGTGQLKGGVEAVVETVINRTAHKKLFRNTVQGVIDQPFQFSAINPLGTWSKLPTASANVTAIVQDYLERRVGGAAGFLRGATHFLNPHLSSATALAEWGNFVVQNAVAEFGNNAKKDVHFHGTAPGTGLPEPHVLIFGKTSPVFDGRGKPLAGMISTGLRSTLLATLEAELAFFGNGKHTETEDPHFLRVGGYWQSIGKSLDGRTLVTMSDGSKIRPAWSAAFVSWAIMQQGVSSARFKGAQAHWVYFNDLLDENLADPLFEVMNPAAYAPQPGDLVHYGRGTAAKFDLAAAKTFLEADSFYPSHSDFVVEVDLAGGTIKTIGGNVDNSVKAKRPKIGSDGLLKPRLSNGKTFPWIAILRLKVV